MDNQDYKSNNENGDGHEKAPWLNLVENGSTEKNLDETSSLPSSTRNTWGSKLDFTMSALSLSVGMGNLWRFPYLCYRNGGGAFLVPYVILAAILGFPLLTLEYVIGQYGQAGIIPVWAACPLFEGIGWVMLVLSACVSVYYVVIISWCLFYIVACFAADVPWRSCDHSWSTSDCVSMADMVIRNNCTAHNGTWYNHTCFSPDDKYPSINNSSNRTTPVSASDQFFHRYMLGLSDGVEDMGLPRWQLVLCLLTLWSLVFLTLARGIKSSGKVMYVTALLPYLVLFILFVRALTLEGSSDGILFFFVPKWHLLASAEVWYDAAVQLFFSLSLMWGAQLTLASFNDFHNNCLRDAAVVVIGDTLTSIFGGVVIFSFLGYMANVLQVPVEKVATQGPGLAFVVYPEGVTTLPFSQFWAILFMLMFISVGIGTQFGIVQTVQTTLVDSFPATLGQGRRPLLLLFAICAIGFLFGLPCVTNGGMYLVQLLDSYSASYGVMLAVFAAIFALTWVYGVRRLYQNVYDMTGYRLSVVWSISWKFVSPALVGFIVVFCLINAKRVSYGGYQLPVYVELIGWIIVAVEVLCIPVVALVKASQLKGPYIQRFKSLCHSLPSWDKKIPSSVSGTDKFIEMYKVNADSTQIDS